MYCWGIEPVHVACCCCAHATHRVWMGCRPIQLVCCCFSCFTYQHFRVPPLFWAEERYTLQIEDVKSCWAFGARSCGVCLFPRKFSVRSPEVLSPNHAGIEMMSMEATNI